MNDTTCVTVAESKLQAEAWMDWSTSGQQSASSRHFTDRYLGMYIFVFLLRRFAICKITRIALCLM